MSASGVATTVPAFLSATKLPYVDQCAKYQRIPFGLHTCLFCVYTAALEGLSLSLGAKLIAPSCRAALHICKEHKAKFAPATSATKALTIDQAQQDHTCCAKWTPYHTVEYNDTAVYSECC